MSAFSHLSDLFEKWASRVASGRRRSAYLDNKPAPSEGFTSGADALSGWRPTNLSQLPKLGNSNARHRDLRKVG